MMKKLLSMLAISLGLSATTMASAMEYTTVQKDKSAIEFTYTQMGVAVDGHFKTFTSQLSFDPAKPSAAKASFDVDLASVDTGAAEGNEEVAGKSWFNTKNFPTARLVSTGVKALGNNRFEITAKLTIKGKTIDMLVPARFTVQGKTGVFDGSFTLRRSDFLIGEGVWSKFDIVANDVLVKFRITTLAK